MVELTFSTPKELPTLALGKQKEVRLDKAGLDVDSLARANSNVRSGLQPCATALAGFDANTKCNFWARSFHDHLGDD